MKIPGTGLTEEEFQLAVQRLDDLVREFEALPYPQIRERVFALLQAVDAIHREGISRLVRLLRDRGHAGLIDAAAGDPAVRVLLMLYDLLPGDERSQAEAALDAVRPYINSHGGEVEVLEVIDGVVHLRLSGSCVGCAGSAITLKRGIETALREGFPGFKGIRLHEPQPSMEVIPLEPVGERTPRQFRRPIFVAVARVEELSPGTLRAVGAGGVQVLIANLDGEFYAVRNQCPGNGAPLDAATFTPPVLVCPWHNEAYDIRTGKRVDGQQGRGLIVVPIAVVDGVLQVAANTIADPDHPLST